MFKRIDDRAYRPDIDGLRAVAVLSVLANHYGVMWLPGGFTGVDVFFVISGYLITGALLVEIPKGGNWIGRFYERRLKRLLPALATVTLFTVVCAHFLLMPGDFSSLGASSTYSVFGLGNIYFYSNTGYFDREAEMQPLLHLWSLGVEEQFYFLWPLVLAGLLKFSGRKALPMVIISIIILSFSLSQHVLKADPKASFYLPWLRAWELAVGALVVFIPVVTNRKLSTLITVTGLMAIGSSLFLLSSRQPFPGIAAVPSVVGAALIVCKKNSVGVSRILTNGIATRVGLLSYSLYLWHWPVLVLYRIYIGGTIPSRWEAMALALISLVLAYLTWRYVEPIRRLPLSITKTITLSALTCMLISALGPSLRLSNNLLGRTKLEVAGSSLEEMWAWSGCRKDENFANPFISSCTFGSKWDQARSRGIIWGDSHAEHFAPYVEAVIPKDVSARLIVPCPPALGGPIRRIWLEQPNYVEQCKVEQDLVVDIINSGKVDWVVLAASWGPLARNVSQDGSLPTGLDGVDMIREGVRQLLGRINHPVKISVLGQSPSNAIDPVPCALNLPRRDCSEQAEMAAAFTRTLISPTDAMFKDMAAKAGFQFISPSSVLCTPTRCDPMFENYPIYRDVSHLRRNLPLGIRADLARKIGLDQIF